MPVAAIVIVIATLSLNVLAYDTNNESQPSNATIDYGLYGIEVAAKLKANLIKSMGYIMHQPRVDIGIDLYVYLDYVSTGLKTNIIDVFDALPHLHLLADMPYDEQFATLVTSLDHTIGGKVRSSDVAKVTCQVSCPDALLHPPNVDIKAIIARFDYNPFSRGIIEYEENAGKLRQLGKVYEMARRTTPKDPQETSVFDTYGPHLLKVVREIKTGKTRLTPRLLSSFLSFLPWPLDDGELNIALADLREYLSNLNQLCFDKKAELIGTPVDMIAVILDDFIKTKTYPEHVKVAARVVGNALKNKLTTPNYRNLFPGEFIKLGNYGDLLSVIDHDNYPPEIVIAGKRVKKFVDKIARHVNLDTLNPYMYRTKEDALLELLKYLQSEVMYANDEIMSSIRAVESYVSIAAKKKSLDYNLFLSILDGLSAPDLYAPIKKRINEIKKYVVGNEKKISEILSTKHICTELYSCYSKIMKILATKFPIDNMTLPSCFLKRSATDCNDSPEFTRAYSDELFDNIRHHQYPAQVVAAAKHIKKYLSTNRKLQKIKVNATQCTVEEVTLAYLSELLNQNAPPDMHDIMRSLVPHLRFQLEHVSELTSTVFKDLILAFITPHFDESLREEMTKAYDFVADNVHLVQEELGVARFHCDEVTSCYNAAAEYLNGQKIGFTFPKFREESPVVDLVRPLTTDALISLINEVQSDKSVELEAAKEYAKDSRQLLDKYLINVEYCKEIVPCFEAARRSLAHAPDLKQNVLQYLLTPTACDRERCEWIAFEESGSTVLNPALEYSKHLFRVLGDATSHLQIKTDVSEIANFLKRADVSDALKMFDASVGTKTEKIVNLLNRLEESPTIKSATKRSAENVRNYLVVGATPKTLHFKNLYQLTETIMENTSDYDARRKLHEIRDKLSDDKYKLEKALADCPIDCGEMKTCYKALRKCFRKSEHVSDLLDFINADGIYDFEETNPAKYMALTVIDDSETIPIILDLSNGEVLSTLNYLYNDKGRPININDGNPPIKLKLDDVNTIKTLEALSEKTLPDMEPIYVPQGKKRPIIALTAADGDGKTTPILIDTNKDSVLNVLKGISSANNKNSNANPMNITDKDGATITVKIDMQHTNSIKALRMMSTRTKIETPFVWPIPRIASIELKAGKAFNLDTKNATIVSFLKRLEEETKNSTHKSSIYVGTASESLRIDIGTDDDAIAGKAFAEMGSATKFETGKDSLAVFTFKDGNVSIPIILNTNDDEVRFALKKLNNSGDVDSPTTILPIVDGAGVVTNVYLHVGDSQVQKSLRALSKYSSTVTKALTVPQPNGKGDMLAMVIDDHGEKVPILLDKTNANVLSTLRHMSQMNENNSDADTIHVYSENETVRIIRVDFSDENSIKTLKKLGRLSGEIKTPFLSHPLPLTKVVVNDEFGNKFVVDLKTNDSGIVVALKDMAAQTINESAATVVYVRNENNGVIPLAIDVTDESIKQDLLNLGSVAKFKSKKQPLAIFTTQVGGVINPIIVDLDDNHVIATLRKLNSSANATAMSVLNVVDKTGMPLSIHLDLGDKTTQDQLNALVVPIISQPIEIPQKDDSKPILVMTLTDKLNNSVPILLDLNNSKVVDTLNFVARTYKNDSNAEIVYLDDSMTIRLDVKDAGTISTLRMLSKKSAALKTPFVTLPQPVATFKINNALGDAFITINTTDSFVVDALENLASETSNATIVYVKKNGQIKSLGIDTTSDDVKNALLELGSVVETSEKPQYTMIMTLEEDDGQRPIMLNLLDGDVMNALKNLNKSTDYSAPATIFHVPNEAGKSETIALNTDSENVRKVLKSLKPATVSKSVHIPRLHGDSITAMTIVDENGETVPVLLDKNQKGASTLEKYLMGVNDSDVSALGIDLKGPKLIELLKNMTKMSSPITTPYITSLSSNASMRVTDEHGDVFVITLDATVAQKLKPLEGNSTNTIFVRNEMGGVTPVGVDVTNDDVKKLLFDIGQVEHVTSRRGAAAIITLKESGGVHPVILDLEDDKVIVTLRALNDSIDVTSPFIIMHVKDKSNESLKILLNIDDENMKMVLGTLGGRTFIEPVEIPLENDRNPIVALTILDSRGELTPVLLDMNNNEVVDALQGISEANADNPEAKVIYTDDYNEVKIDYKHEETLETLVGLTKLCETLKSPFVVPPTAMVSVQINDELTKLIVTLNSSDAEVSNAFIDMDLETVEDSPYTIAYVLVNGEVRALTIDTTNENIKKRLLEIGDPVPINSEKQHLAIFVLREAEETTPIILNVGDVNTLHALRQLNNSVDLNNPLTIVHLNDSIVYLNMDNNNVKKMLKKLGKGTVISKPVAIPQVNRGPVLALTVHDSKGGAVPVLLDTGDDSVMRALNRISRANAHNPKAKIVYVDVNGGNVAPIRVDVNDDKAAHVLTKLSKTTPYHETPFVTPTAAHSSIQFDRGNGSKYVVTIKSNNSVLALGRLANASRVSDNVAYLRNDNGSATPIAIDRTDRAVQDALLELDDVTEIQTRNQSIVAFTVELGDKTNPVVFELSDGVLSTLKHLNNSVDFSLPLTTLHLNDQRGGNVTIYLNMGRVCDKAVLRILGDAILAPIEIPQVNAPEPIVALSLRNKDGNVVPIILNTSNGDVMNELRIISERDDNLNATVIYVQGDEAILADLTNDRTIQALEALSTRSRLTTPFVTPQPTKVSAQIYDRNGNKLVVALNLDDKDVVSALEDLGLTTPGTSTIYVNTDWGIKPLNIDFTNEHVRETLLETGDVSQSHPKQSALIFTTDHYGKNRPSIIDAMNDDVLVTMKQLSNSVDETIPMTVVYVRDKKGNVSPLTLNMGSKRFKRTIQTLDSIGGNSKALITQIPRINSKKPMVVLVDSENVTSILDLNDTEILDTLKRTSRDNVNNPNAKLIYADEENGKIEPILVDLDADKKLVRRLSENAPQITTPFVTPLPAVATIEVEDKGKIYLITLHIIESMVIDALKDLALETTDAQTATIIYIGNGDDVTPLAIDVNNDYVKQNLFQLGRATQINRKVQSMLVYTTHGEGGTKLVVLGMRDEIMPILKHLNDTVDRNFAVTTFNVTDSEGHNALVYLNMNSKVKAVLESMTSYGDTLQPVEIPQVGRNSMFALTVADGDQLVHVLLNMSDENVVDALTKLSMKYTNNSGAQILYVAGDGDEKTLIRVDVNDGNTTKVFKQLSKEMSNTELAFVTPVASVIGVPVDETGNKITVVLNMKDEAVVDALRNLTSYDATSTMLYYHNDDDISAISIDVTNDSVKRTLFAVGHIVPVESKTPLTIALTIDNDPIFLRLDDIDVITTLKQLNNSIVETLPMTTIYLPDNTGNSLIRLNMDTKVVKNTLKTLRDRSSTPPPFEIPQPGHALLALTVVKENHKLPMLLDLNDPQIVDVLKRLSNETDAKIIAVLQNDREIFALALNLTDDATMEILSELPKTTPPIFTPFVKPPPRMASFRLLTEDGGKYITLNLTDTLVLDSVKALETKLNATNDSVYIYEDGVVVALPIDLTDPKVQETLLEISSVANDARKPRPTLICTLETPVMLDLSDDHVLNSLKKLNSSADGDTIVLGIPDKKGSISNLYLRMGDENVKEILESLPTAEITSPISIPQPGTRGPTLALAITDDKSNVEPILLDTNNREVIDVLINISEINRNDTDAKIIHTVDFTPIRVNLNDQDQLNTLRKLTKLSSEIKQPFIAPLSSTSLVHFKGKKGTRFLATLNASDPNVVAELKELNVDESDRTRKFYIRDGDKAIALAIDTFDRNTINSLFRVASVVRIADEEFRGAVLVLNDSGRQVPIILDFSRRETVQTLQKLNARGDDPSVMFMNFVDELGKEIEIKLNMEDEQVRDALKKLSETQRILEPIEIPQPNGRKPILALNFHDGNSVATPVLLDLDKEIVVNNLKRISRTNDDNLDAKVIYVDQSEPIRLDFGDENTAVVLKQLSDASLLKMPFVKPGGSTLSLRFEYKSGEVQVTLNTNETNVVETLKELSLRTTNTSQATVLYVPVNGGVLPLALDFSNEYVKEMICIIGRVVPIARDVHPVAVFTLTDDAGATVPVILDLGDEDVVSTLKNLTNFFTENSSLVILHVKRDKTTITIRLDMADEKTLQTLRELGAKTKNQSPIYIPRVGEAPLLALTLPDSSGTQVLLDTKLASVNDLLNGADFNDQNTADALIDLSKSTPTMKMPFLTTPAALISIPTKDVYNENVVGTLNATKPNVLRFLRKLEEHTVNYSAATVFYIPRGDGNVDALALDLTDKYVRKRLTETGRVDLIKSTKETFMVVTLDDDDDQPHPVILDLANVDVLSSLKSLEKFVDANFPLTIAHVADAEKNDVAIRLNLENDNTKLIMKNLMQDTPGYIQPILIPQMPGRNPFIAITLAVYDNHIVPVVLDTNNATILDTLRRMTEISKSNPRASSIYITDKDGNTELFRIDFKIDAAELLNLAKASPKITNAYISRPSMFTTIQMRNNEGVRVTVTLNTTNEEDIETLSNLVSFISDESALTLIYVGDDGDAMKPLLIDPTDIIVQNTLLSITEVTSVENAESPYTVISISDDRGDTKTIIIEMNKENVIALKKLSKFVDADSTMSVVLAMHEGAAIPITLDLNNRKTIEILESLAAKTYASNIRIPTLGGEKLTLAIREGDDVIISHNISDLKEEDVNLLKNFTKFAPLIQNPYCTLMFPFLAVPITDERGQKVVVTIDTSDRNALKVLTALSIYMTDTSPVFYYYNKRGDMEAIALNVDEPDVKKALLSLGYVTPALPQKESVVAFTIIGDGQETIPFVFDVDDPNVTKLLRNMSVNVDYGKPVMVVNAQTSEGYDVPISFNVKDTDTNVLLQKISRVSPVLSPMIIGRKSPIIVFTLYNSDGNTIPIIIDPRNTDLITTLERLNSNKQNSSLIYIPIDEYRTHSVNLDLNDENVIKTLQNLAKKNRPMGHPHVASTKITHVQVPDGENYVKIIPINTNDDAVNTLKTLSIGELEIGVEFNVKDSKGELSTIRINPKDEITMETLVFLARKHFIRPHPAHIVPPNGTRRLIPIEISNVNGGTVSATLDPNDEKALKKLSELLGDGNVNTEIEDEAIQLNLLSPATAIVLERLSATFPIQIATMRIYPDDNVKPLIGLEVTKGDESTPFTIDPNDPVVIDELNKISTSPDAPAMIIHIDDNPIRLNLHDEAVLDTLEILTKTSPVNIIPVKCNRPFIRVGDLVVDSSDPYTIQKLIEVSKLPGSSPGTTFEFIDDDGFAIPVTLKLHDADVANALKAMKNNTVASYNVLEPGDRWPLTSLSVLHGGVTTPITLNAESALNVASKFPKTDGWKLEVQDRDGNRKRLHFDLTNLDVVESLIEATENRPYHLYPFKIIPAYGHAPIVIFNVANRSINLDVNNREVLGQLKEMSRRADSPSSTIEIQFDDGKCVNLKLDLNDSATVETLLELSNKSAIYVSPAHQMPILHLVANFETIDLNLGDQLVIEEFEELTKMAGEDAHELHVCSPFGEQTIFKLDLTNRVVFERCREMAGKPARRRNLEKLVIVGDDVVTNVTVDIDNPFVSNILYNFSTHGFHNAIIEGSATMKFDLSPTAKSELVRLALNVSERFHSSMKPRLTTVEAYDANGKVAITLDLNDNQVVNMLKKLSKLFKAKSNLKTFMLYVKWKRVLVSVDVTHPRVVDLLKSLSIPTHGRNVKKPDASTVVMLRSGMSAIFDPTDGNSAREILQIARSHPLGECPVWVNIWDDFGQSAPVWMDFNNPDVTEKILRIAKPTRNQTVNIDSSLLQYIIAHPSPACNYSNGDVYLSPENRRKFDFADRPDGSTTFNFNLSKDALRLSDEKICQTRTAKMAVLFASVDDVRTPIYLNLTDEETLQVLGRAQSLSGTGDWVIVYLGKSTVITLDLSNTTTLDLLLKVSMEVEHEIASEYYSKPAITPVEIPGLDNAQFILDLGSARTLAELRRITESDQENPVTVKLRDSFGLPVNLKIDVRNGQSMKRLETLHAFKPSGDEEFAISSLLEFAFNASLGIVTLRPVETRLYTLDSGNATTSLDLDLQDSLAVKRMRKLSEKLNAAGVGVGVIDQEGMLSTQRSPPINDATMKLFKHIFGENTFPRPSQYILTFPDTNGVKQPFVLNANSEIVNNLKNSTRNDRVITIDYFGTPTNISVSPWAITKLHAADSAVMKNEASLNKIVDYIYASCAMKKLRKTLERVNSREANLDNFRSTIIQHLSSTFKVFVPNELGAMQPFNESFEGDSFPFITQSLYEYLEDHPGQRIQIQSKVDTINIEIDEYDDHDDVISVDRSIQLLETGLKKSKDGVIYVRNDKNRMIPIKEMKERNRDTVKLLILLHTYLTKSNGAIYVKNDTSFEKIDEEFLRNISAAHPIVKSLHFTSELEHFYDVKAAWYAYVKVYDKSNLYTIINNRFTSIRSNGTYEIGDVSKSFFSDVPLELYVKNSQHVLIPTNVKTSRKLSKFLENFARNSSAIRDYDIVNVLANEIKISKSTHAYLVTNGSLKFLDLDGDDDEYKINFKSLVNHILTTTRNTAYIESHGAYKKVWVGLKMKDRDGVSKYLTVANQHKMSLRFGDLAKLRMLLQSYLITSNNTVYVKGDGFDPIIRDANNQKSVDVLNGVITGYAVGAPRKLFIKNSKDKIVPISNKNPPNIEQLISILNSYMLGGPHDANEADKTFAFLKSYMTKRPSVKIYKKTGSDLEKVVSVGFYKDLGVLAVDLNEFLMGVDTHVIFENANGKNVKVSLNDEPMKATDMHTSKIVVENTDAHDFGYERVWKLLRDVYKEPEFSGLLEEDDFKHRMDTIEIFVKVLNSTNDLLNIDDDVLLENFREHLRPHSDWDEHFKYDRFMITPDLRKNLYYTIHLPRAMTKEQYEQLPILKSVFQSRFAAIIIDKLMKEKSVKISTVIRYLLDNEGTLSEKQRHALNVYLELIGSMGRESYGIESSMQVIDIGTIMDIVFKFSDLSMERKGKFNAIIDFVEENKKFLSSWDFEGKSNVEIVDFMFDRLKNGLVPDEVKSAVLDMEKLIVRNGSDEDGKQFLWIEEVR